MSIGHSLWEPKLVVAAVCLLFLHCNWVTLGLRMIFPSLLVKSDFSKDSLTKFLQNFVDTFLNVFPCSSWHFLNLFRDFSSSDFLGCCKVIDFLWFCCCQGIDECVGLHLKHELPVLRKVITEVVLKHEEVLFKLIDSSELIFAFDVPLPWPHEFPSFELLEKWKVLDVVVWVSLNQPLP